MTEAADQNRDLIRAALRTVLVEQRAAAKTRMQEMQAARRHVAGDADHLPDLHCDPVTLWPWGRAAT